MAACRLPASWPFFSPMPFRSPVTEWHVLHLPTDPLKNASPAFGSPVKTTFAAGSTAAKALPADLIMQPGREVDAVIVRKARKPA